MIFVVEYTVRGSYQKRGEKSRVFYKQIFLLCFSDLSFCNGRAKMFALQMRHETEREENGVQCDAGEVG